MPQWAIYSTKGDLKELVADYFINDQGFFTFYDDPTSDMGAQVRFTIATSQVSTIERIG